METYDGKKIIIITLRDIWNQPLNHDKRIFVHSQESYWITDQGGYEDFLLKEKRKKK